MIYLLTLFNGWKEITEEEARSYAKHIFNGAIALSTDEKLECINRHLKGIQFTKEDLLEDRNG